VTPEPRAVTVVRMGQEHRAAEFAEVLADHKEKAERRYGRTARRNRAKRRATEPQDDVT